MNYSELIQLYFERSTSLQNYWTLYVVVIGGLLAISTLRVRPDLLTVALVTLLFCFFAYKNLDAIHDVTLQRGAVIEAIRQTPTSADIDPLAKTKQRDLFAPTLVNPDWDGTRNFHYTSDIVTLLLIWGMEWRRFRHTHADKPHP